MYIYKFGKWVEYIFQILMFRKFNSSRIFVLFDATNK